MNVERTIKFQAAMVARNIKLRFAGIKQRDEEAGNPKEIVKKLKERLGDREKVSKEEKLETLSYVLEQQLLLIGFHDYIKDNCQSCYQIIFGTESEDAIKKLIDMYEECS